MTSTRKAPFSHNTMSRALFLLLLLCLPGLETSAATPLRQQLVFDYGWKFHLCQDTTEVVSVLQQLGITDRPHFGTDAPAPKGGATVGETEPEIQTAQTEAAVGVGAPTGSANGGKETNASAAFADVQLPHDWSIALPIDPKQGGSAGYLPGGQGIYTKDFTLPSSIKSNDQVAVYFGAAYHRATVWLNGHKLGYHMYGYTGFEMDMTPYLNRKGQNRLVVHLNTEEKSRWYTGAGIYRHAYLHVTGRQHIKTWGVYAKVTCEDGQWTIAPEVELTNGEGCKVSHQVLDAQGKVRIKTFSGSAVMDNPRLWTLDDPYLYILRTCVRDARGRLVDQTDTRFGVRSFSFDADRGFSLNGQPMKLKGMCLHQDVGTLGVAVPDRVMERRLQALKDFGCNAIRSSHNPASEEFLNICDTLGLLVLDEAFDKWKSGFYAPFFDDNAVQDITDMVVSHRNHPSIIIWSIGNEVQEAWNEDEVGVERARMFNDLVHRLDPTRPTLVACQQGFQDKFGEVTDLVGYNYLEPRMVADHKRHPNRKLLVTEAFVYYSGLRENIVRDWVERNPWYFVEDNDFVAGSFLWAGVDYHGESSPWPAKGWCSCPFDMTLEERPQAAYYHPAWKPEEPYLKLVVRDNCFDQAVGTDHWQYPIMADTWDLPFSDGRTVQIRCYTTCDSVQFYFPMWSNPQLPLKPRVTANYPDHTITLQLPARHGKVLAVGYKDGQPILRDSLVNRNKVADLKMECDRSSLVTLPKELSAAGGSQQNVAHVRLTLVDKDGFRQQMDPRLITAEVEGQGTLLGIETGDFRRDGFTGQSIKSYFGSALLRIQSAHETGNIRVKVTVEGLPEPYYLDIPVKGRP